MITPMLHIAMNEYKAMAERDKIALQSGGGGKKNQSKGGSSGVRAGDRRADRICARVSQKHTQTEEAAGVRECDCADRQPRREGEHCGEVGEGVSRMM